MSTRLSSTLTSIMGFSTAHNSYEQDNRPSQETSQTDQRHHLRIRSDSFVDDFTQSNPASPTSPSTFVSFILPPFLTTPPNKNNNVNNNATTTSKVPNTQRRVSESVPDVGLFNKQVPNRRYTFPTIIPFVVAPLGPGEKGSSAHHRVPTAHFWEVGGREDSSVQVAMEQVQFGL